jgi:hypothetical protein
VFADGICEDEGWVAVMRLVELVLTENINSVMRSTAWRSRDRDEVVAQDIEAGLECDRASTQAGAQHVPGDKIPSPEVVGENIDGGAEPTPASPEYAASPEY